jgi:hypothetical protein
LQIPQLGLQHTRPTLQVIMPQLSLFGYVTGLRQVLVLGPQLSPGRMHCPQTGSQQSSPLLHVVGPQLGLSTVISMLHVR